MRKTLVTLTGPTCAGKSTLEELLIKAGYPRVISNTSRQPRAGEVDGVHYHFRSPAWFEDHVARNALVEQVYFNGNWYGNTQADIEQATSETGLASWVIEPIGHKQVKSWAQGKGDLRLYSVFVNNPLSVIMDRFMRRWRANGCPDSQLGRLEAMLGQERNWVQEATFDYGGRLYDLFVPTFDEGNRMSVLWEILSATTRRRMPEAA
jgi:guanylate kinase